MESKQERTGRQEKELPPTKVLLPTKVSKFQEVENHKPFLIATD